MHVDPAKKEVSCWIASEAGKVCESLFTMTSCSFQTNLDLFHWMVGSGRWISIRRPAISWWLFLQKDFTRMPHRRALYISVWFCLKFVTCAVPIQQARCHRWEGTSTACIPRADRMRDDDAYLDISPSHSIGEIRLVIDRTTPRIEEKKQVTTYQVPPDLQKVHERSKKAIAHRVK